MPVIDVVRIKIEQVDKATHRVIPVAEGGEKYIIRCNEKAVLTPVYIGGKEYVYEVDNTVVEYNVENTVLYGMNLQITTASFDWYCFRLVHGGSVIGQQVQRGNLLAGNTGTMQIVTIPSYASTAYSSSYPEMVFVRYFYVHPFDTSVTPPVSQPNVTDTEQVTNASTGILLVQLATASNATKELWKNDIKNNYANIPMGNTGSQVPVNLHTVILNRASNVRKPFYFPAYENSYNYISEIDRIALFEENDKITANKSMGFLNRKLLGMNTLYTWNEMLPNRGRMVYAAHIKRGFFGANAAPANRIYAIPGVTYNITYFSNLDSAPTYSFSEPVNAANLIPLSTIWSSLYRSGVFTTVVTMHPRPWEIYPILYLRDDDHYVTNQQFAEMLDNDDYLLDWYDTLANQSDPPVSDLGVQQALFANGGNGANQDPRAIFSRHEYQYTYPESEEVCMTAITFVNLAGITGATNILSDARCIEPSVNVSNSAAHYGLYVREAIAMPSITVAGGRSVSDQPYSISGFASEEEYLENVDYFQNASDDEINLPTGSYISPFSAGGNPSDLFKTTLYTKDYLGADIASYVKLQFPMCYSDFPGKTISTQFNDNVFNIYARDDFINRASTFNAQAMTQAEYEAEAAADDADIEAQ